MEDAPHVNEGPFPQDLKSWVDSYKVSCRFATAELLSMLFEAFGVKYSIKEEQLDRDVDDVVVALVNLARAGEVEDYQISRKELLSFWNNLIIECQDGPLFDKLLFPKCMDYIIALSNTAPRHFRRKATLIGLQLVRSFIFVAKTLNKSLSAQITSLEIMIVKIFDELFVDRYQDIDPDIRLSCIQSLGIWISSYPSLFLQDRYLEYLGWTLNDKATGVRKASLLALRKLYERDKDVPSLGSFTVRFSGRMVELADDVDIPTAVCAISLVKQLLRHQLIPDYDLRHFYKLLVVEHQEIRRAIAELVYDDLIAQKFNSSLSGLTGHVDSSSEISRMLKVLRECCTYQTQYVYAIDNVWEYMKAMKDWECIISMLLEEPQTWCTNDEDSTNLIGLLFASVRKAVGEKIIHLTDNRKLDHSEAQRKILENNRKDITVAMMKNYPLLLRKFKADKGKVSSLVEIITFMKLELYALERQEQFQSFKDAVQFIKDAFFLNGEKEALRSCVKAITFCASESKGKLQDFSREELKDLEEKLLEKLTSAIQDVKDGKDESPLIVNLKRLYELQLSKHFPFEDMYDELASMLHNIRNLDEKVICFLLLNMHVDVVRSLRSIVDCETLPEASLSSLISKRGTLFEELSYFLNRVEVSGKYGSQLSFRICAILAEEWCAFEKSKFDSTRLEKLGYCPEMDMVDSFWKHCQGILNNSDEEDENREYIIETNIDVAAIAACKLVTSDVVAKDYLGPEIISHLGMHGPSITDIIENFITNLRKTEADISNIYLESLKRGYQRYANELSSGGGGEPIVDKCLEVCRELAGQLSGMYIGAARNKLKSEILSVVNGGVDYAFIDPPKQLFFLEVAILPFATRLSVQDMRKILLDVKERTLYVNTDEDPSGWLPYFNFLENLEKEYHSVVDDGEDGEDEGCYVSPLNLDETLNEREHTMHNIDEEVLNSRGPSFEFRSDSPDLAGTEGEPENFAHPSPQLAATNPSRVHLATEAPPQAIPRNRKHFDNVTILSNRIMKKRLRDASDTLRKRRLGDDISSETLNKPLLPGYPDDLCALFEKDTVVSKQHFAFVDETIAEREVSPTASSSPQASPTPSIPYSVLSPTLNEREHNMPNIDEEVLNSRGPLPSPDFAGSEGERENFVHSSPQLAATNPSRVQLATEAPPQAIPRNRKHFDNVTILSNRIMKKRLRDASDTLRKRENNPSKNDQFSFNVPLFTGYSDDLCSLLEMDCVVVSDGTIPEGASVSSPSVPQSPVADTVHLSPSPPPQARPRKRMHFDDVIILHDRNMGQKHEDNTLRKRNEFASSEIHIWRMNNQLKNDQILNEPLLTGYSDSLRSLFEKGFKVMVAPVARVLPL